MRDGMKAASNLFRRETRLHRGGFLMHGLTLVFLGLALAADPIELPKDVQEIRAREFAMPLHVVLGLEDGYERVCLFVSDNRGRTWKHDRDYKPTD
jgi:hypothetical protein